MHRSILPLTIISLLFTSCEKGGQGESSSLLESPFFSRPIVAVVPMISRTSVDLTWNVSQELSNAIRQRLTQRNHLYLMNEEAVSTMARRALSHHDPFEQETTWVKKGFPQNEVVAFMELLEHHEASLYPTKEAQDSPSELNLTVRVRVFDLRDQTPRVVLEEIVQQSHHIPKPFNKANFSQVAWGDEAFEISPLGIAHEALTKEIAGRIEDYILLSGRQ